MMTAAQAVESPARLTFRMAVPEDSAEIVGLLNYGFRTPMDEATWKWYVYGNPLGSSRVYTAFAPDHQMVGVIGFAPIPLVVRGERLIADYAHHLVLKTEFRDTLSYVAILRHSLKGQESHGVQMIIGPPNKRAYPIHKTLMKWFDYGYLDRLRKLSPTARPHTCAEAISFPASFDAFYNEIAKDLQCGLHKTAEWMNWRFANRPGSPYVIYTAASGESFSGYIVLKFWCDEDGYRKVHIVDMHARSTDVLAELLAAGESWAAERAAQEINLWAVEGYLYRAALEGLGYECDHRQPLLAKTFDGIRHVWPAGPCSLSYGDGDTLY